jgi:calcineurin-like phosphoesterase family protein
MSKTWFWGDPHFGHRNILKHEPTRPFIDTEHMDNTIIENYNQTVGDGDIVFWLGDMFFTNAERTAYILNRLKLDGKRNNHDKQTDNWYRRKGFDPHKMYLFGGMMLTHHPMTPENLAKLKQYSPALLGNVHAHTHSATTDLDPSRWQCVSLEMVDYKPISWSNLRMRFLDNDAKEHWHNTTNGQLDYFKTGDHLRV